MRDISGHLNRREHALKNQYDIETVRRRLFLTFWRLLLLLRRGPSGANASVETACSRPMVGERARNLIGVLCCVSRIRSKKVVLEMSQLVA